MSNKLVSIIIPTFNRAFPVVEAIRSAQSQSYPAKQIIVIDDGSQDNTPQLVAQFTGIEYYRQENRGQAAARNLGLSYARGEYIASLDSDDIWQSEFLTDGVKCLEKHRLDFVFLNWIGTDGKENFLNSRERQKIWRKMKLKRDADWFLLESEQLRRLFLEGCPSPSSSLLIRRSSLVSTWNEQMLMADDWFLILEMVISKPCRAAFTLSPYWLKRVFGDNIYDGRDMLEIITKAIVDEQVMARSLNPHLRAAEKYIIRTRLACYHLNYARLKWKYEGVSKKTLSEVVSAFILAPVGITFYLLKMFIYHLKHCIRTRLFSY